MKSKLAFSPDVIEFIHNRSRQFIESSHSDEMVFFEDIWEIYEEHLEKWINKPPRKWKFRTSKLKIPNFLSVSGGPDTLDLITPKILEVISLSYAQIIALKEHSLERIQEVISKCVKKLPRDIREETVSYLAPLMLKDSKKVLNAPKTNINKRYIIYSHLGGEKLSREEYLNRVQELEKNRNDYLLLINEVKREFYIDGDPKVVPNTPKMVLKILIQNVGRTVKYRELYKSVLGIEPGNEKLKYGKEYRNLVHKWISDFHKKTDDLLSEYLKTDYDKGYVLCFGKDIKYCLIDHLPE